MQGELRRKWFAAGDMPLEVGAPVELVWRNDELSDPPGQRPAGSSKDNRMQSRVLELEPLRRLTISWGASGGSVSFELEPQRDGVLLTIVHSGVPDRASALNFGPGWHAHLDVLAAILAGEKASAVLGRDRPSEGRIRRAAKCLKHLLPAVAAVELRLEDEMSNEKYGGGCRCGALRYEANAEPMFMNHCQCLDCQHLSGTGHGSYLTFPREHAVQTGEAVIREVLGDSGSLKHHASCATCGSPVSLTFAAMPSLFTVHAASLDDPSRFRPQAITYSKRAQPWDKLGTELQRFEAMPNT